MLAQEPAFGLCLAESRRLSNLGPLALLVRDASTLREALETLMHHMHVHNEAVAVQVDAHGGLVVIRFELTAPGAWALHQATELVIGVACRVLQVLLGAPWRPRLVCFMHAEPASLAAHHRVLALVPRQLRRDRGAPACSRRRTLIAGRLIGRAPVRAPRALVQRPCFIAARPPIRTAKTIGGRSCRSTSVASAPAGPGGRIHGGARSRRPAQRSRPASRVSRRG